MILSDSSDLISRQRCILPRFEVETSRSQKYHSVRMATQCLIDKGVTFNPFPTHAREFTSSPNAVTSFPRECPDAIM